LKKKNKKKTSVEFEKEKQKKTSVEYKKEKTKKDKKEKEKKLSLPSPPTSPVRRADSILLSKKKEFK